MKLSVSTEKENQENEGVVIEKQMGVPDSSRESEKPRRKPLFSSSRSSHGKAAESGLSAESAKGGPALGGGNKKKKKDKPKRKFKWWIIPIVLLVGILAVAGVYVNKIIQALHDIGIEDVNLGTVSDLIFDTDKAEIKSTDGKTNFLLVGIDTRPHSGLMNTDTIMLISLNNATGHISMISIPRDTEAKYTIDGKNYTTKINSAYWRYAQKHGEAEGMTFFRDIVSEITGQPIHYAALVNYNAFVEAVDQVGGLEVCVERSFSADYPKPGDEVGEGVPGEEITVHFDEGCQFMDGERALIYARARKSNSVEGSDYARAARQQKVVQAFYEKFSTSSFYSQYESAMAFLDILGENVKLYDVGTEDIKAAYEARDSVDAENMTSVVLSPAIDYYRLIKAGSDYRNAPTAGAGEWEEVNGYIEFLLEHPDVFAEEPEVGVYNGGAGGSVVTSAVNDLNNGYLLARNKGTASVSNCTQNQVGLVPGADPKNASLLYLQSLYSAELITDLPVSGKGVDIVLILCETPAGN